MANPIAAPEVDYGCKPTPECCWPKKSNAMALGVEPRWNPGTRKWSGRLFDKLRASWIRAKRGESRATPEDVAPTKDGAKIWSGRLDLCSLARCPSIAPRA